MTPAATGRRLSVSLRATIAVALATGALLAIAYWRIIQQPDDELSRLTAAFREYSSARLVFERSQLPQGEYHEVMRGLSPQEREDAARIALREVHKHPRRYLGNSGLSAVGIFQSCVSTRADGYRDYDEELQGYRYYGIYNGSCAIAAAYYTDRQLPLTLHHEIFHHIERVASLADRNWANDRWAGSLSGDDLYPSIKLSPANLTELERRSSGEVLQDSVSDYAAKNPVEDRAETARYLLSTLPDSLVQAARRPQLPGSQRILHILETYHRAPNGHGPDVDWFVEIALGRVTSASRANDHNVR